MMQITLLNIYCIHSVFVANLVLMRGWPIYLHLLARLLYSFLVSYNKLIGYRNYANNFIYCLLYSYLLFEKSGPAKTGPLELFLCLYDYFILHCIDIALIWCRK